MSSPTRVLLIDDNPDMTEMLGYVLANEPGLECAGSLHCADDLTATVRRLRPDVVVLDAIMPGKPPLIAMAELAAEFPEVRVLVHSGYDDAEFVESAMSLGAWGFVSKNRGQLGLVHAIREAGSGAPSPLVPRPHLEPAGS